MKAITAIALVLLTAFPAAGQKTNPAYDSALATKLGADEYGMKMYVMVILKTGSNNVQDPVKRDSLFAGHMANISKLAEMRKLVVAGPFGDNKKSYRGIFIFDVPSFEEANKLLEDDPTIKEKVFEAELYHWYGSAALSEYLEASEKIWKVNH